MSTSLIDKRESLRTMLSEFTLGEQVYLVSLIRGYSPNEAVELTKGLGINLTTALLDPHLVTMRDYLLDNGWHRKGEGEDFWGDLLSRHYTEVVILAGLKELNKEKERSSMLIKEATKLVIAKKPKDKVLEGGSYDEMILKRHITIGDKA